jgi:hypothetical protein
MVSVLQALAHDRTVVLPAAGADGAADGALLREYMLGQCFHLEVTAVFDLAVLTHGDDETSEASSDSLHFPLSIQVLPDDAEAGNAR